MNRESDDAGGVAPSQADATPREWLTREQFLARCANAFDAGLCSPYRLRLMDAWLEAVMRIEGGQLMYLAGFINAEARRTGYFASTLDNDKDGCALVQLAAILNHSCQACATDPKAGSTLAALCPHVKPV